MNYLNKDSFRINDTSNNLKSVIDGKGNEIKDHLGRDVLLMEKSQAKTLCDDLNDILIAHTDDQSWALNLRLSLVYCVISTLSFEEREETQIDVKTAIQWDRIFRPDPGPPGMLTQLNARSAIKEALNLELPNLALNYAQSIEEMKKEQNTEFVPENFIRKAIQIERDLNRHKKFGVSLLGKEFNNFSLLSILLFINNQITAKEFLRLYFAFVFGMEYSDLEDGEQMGFDFQLDRLEYLKEYLKGTS